MVYPLGQIGMRSESSPTLNKRTISKSKRGDEMENTSFMRAEEVAQELGISKSYSCKIVREMNRELKAQGYLTVAGKCPAQYFKQKFYGFQIPGGERKEGK